MLVRAQLMKHTHENRYATTLVFSLCKMSVDKGNGVAVLKGANPPEAAVYDSLTASTTRASASGAPDRWCSTEIASAARTNQKTRRRHAHARRVLWTPYTDLGAAMLRRHVDAWISDASR